MWLKATIFHSLECKTAERTQNNRAPPLLIDSHFWDTYWKTSHFYDYRRPRPKLWPNKVILGTFVTITKIGVLYEHYDKVTIFWAQKLFNKSLASYLFHLN